MYKIHYDLYTNHWLFEKYINNIRYIQNEDVDIYNWPHKET